MFPLLGHTKSLSTTEKKKVGGGEICLPASQHQTPPAALWGGVRVRSSNMEAGAACGHFQQQSILSGSRLRVDMRVDLKLKPVGGGTAALCTNYSAASMHVWFTVTQWNEPAAGGEHPRVLSFSFGAHISVSIWRWLGVYICAYHMYMCSCVSITKVM